MHLVGPKGTIIFNDVTSAKVVWHLLQFSCILVHIERPSLQESTLVILPFLSQNYVVDTWVINVRYWKQLFLWPNRIPSHCSCHVTTVRNGRLSLLCIDCLVLHQLFQCGFSANSSNCRDCAFLMDIHFCYGCSGYILSVLEYSYVKVSGIVCLISLSPFDENNFFALKN